MQAAIDAGAGVNKALEFGEDRKDVLRAASKRIYAGDTPLLIAVRNSGSIECLKLLIEAGADVNKGSPGHGTPLCVAVKWNNIKCSKLLINAGADVNIMSLHQGTPLYVAVRQENIKCVKMLIESGADVNSEVTVKVGRRPRTTMPLNAAMYHANVECLKILLDAGADVKIHEYATDLYLWFNIRPTLDTKIRCVQLILSKGALVNQPGKFWSSVLESFLSFLGENESAMKGVILIMAAGEHGEKLVQVKACVHSLRTECRETIRRHLLSINNINLLFRVQQLPLPAALKSFLLYDVTLNEDYVTNDISDDVDFICKKFFLRRFEYPAVD